ncbi:hypothetical protein DTO280E4_409 [Paecilomyces variotii]|nr:hypothetical protein DTO280E4_409 [Paecilomyces variotii]
MTDKRIYFKVHGTVQGVNFRNFTDTRANDYGLVGFVRNTSDGKVEGEAQGSDESLQKLLKDINKGPRLAHVVKVEKQEIDPKEGEKEQIGDLHRNRNTGTAFRLSESLESPSRKHPMVIWEATFSKLR